MFFPKLTAPPQQRVTADRFLGLDRRAGSAMGGMQDMENLWAGGYPALETRPARGIVAAVKAPGGLVCRDAPVWVDGTALYVNGVRTGLTLTEGDKQLVSMGAYLLIWPDKKFINTQELTEFGGLENRTVTTGEVTISLCRSSGEALGSYSIGEEAPASPGTGSLWMDTADGEPVLKRYDGTSWLEVEDVCTRAASAGIGRGFRAGDGVTVEGCETEGVDGLHVLQAVDAAFRHYKVDTEGYIRTGIVSYDGAVPVYGVAVGQDLVCREVDGEQVVEQNNFRAVFTATRLSFWQDATEVAYVSNNRLYITNITVLGGIAIGDWSVEAAESGLAFRWIGG